jgi:hypothetical protein
VVLGPWIAIQVFGVDLEHIAHAVRASFLGARRAEDRGRYHWPRPGRVAAGPSVPALSAPRWSS